MNIEKFVNPKKSYPKVFIFPIHNNLKRGLSVYEATRRAWNWSESMREKPFGIAVGIKDKISQGVFEIKGWHQDIQANKKWEFDGTKIEEMDDFHNTNWSKIINEAIGYWQYGNYLIVEFIEFNGNIYFRFIRGGDKNKLRSF